MRILSKSIVIAAALTFSTSVFSQDAAPAIKLPNCKAPPAKRPIKTVPQKFIKKVAPIDELIQPATDEKTGVTPEPNYQEGWRELKKLMDRCDDCSKSELAFLYQRAAIVQYNLDNIDETVKYFKMVVAQAPEIPTAQEAAITYQIAQIYYSQEKYKLALETFDKWESLCPSTVSDSYFYTRAHNYFMLGDKAEALRQVQKSIDLVLAKGEVPQESWYRLKLSIYIDKEDFKGAEKVAEEIVYNYPSIRMISQLASIYGVNGKIKRQLALLDALFISNKLEKESDYKRLAYAYLDQEAPYLSAKVVQGGLKAEHVNRNAKNLEVLGVALQQAREWDDALPIMEEAASKSDDGKIYANLAAAYLGVDKFDEAVKAGEKALKKKGLRSEAEVQLRIGSAYIGMEKFNDAIKVLKKIRKDERYGEFAVRMIRYAESEIRRIEGLRQTQAAAAS